MCHRALEVSGDWFAYISRTTARQRAGRLGRKLPKIAHLRLRFVCLLNLCLNRDGLERPLPIWAAATDHETIERRKLIGLLPRRLHQLDVPEEVAAELVGGPKLSTIAVLIVVYTEELIKAYLTEKGLSDRTPANPANVKAAIRKFRKALEPLDKGWVDDETASIIPDDLAERLARREREIEKLRLTFYQRRRLDLLCEHIGVGLTRIASANQVTFEISGMIEFITTALDYAGIEHSYSAQNPSRFAARVFPKSNSE